MKGYQLKPNSYFKLGNTIIHLKEIVLNEEYKQTSNRVTKQNPSIIPDKLCRICLGSNDNNKIIILPCKCNGSIKYAHIQCLSEWMATKLNRSLVGRNPNLYRISPEKFTCDLCKNEIPCKFSTFIGLLIFT